MEVPTWSRSPFTESSHLHFETRDPSKTTFTTPRACKSHAPQWSSFIQPSFFHSSSTAHRTVSDNSGRASIRSDPPSHNRLTRARVTKSSATQRSASGNTRRFTIANHAPILSLVLFNPDSTLRSSTRWTTNTPTLSLRTQGANLRTRSRRSCIANDGRKRSVTSPANPRVQCQRCPLSSPLYLAPHRRVPPPACRSRLEAGLDDALAWLPTRANSSKDTPRPTCSAGRCCRGKLEFSSKASNFSFAHSFSQPCGGAHRTFQCRCR